MPACLSLSLYMLSGVTLAPHLSLPPYHCVAEVPWALCHREWCHWLTSPPSFSKKTSCLLFRSRTGRVSDSAKRDCCQYKYLLACYGASLPADGLWRFDVSGMKQRPCMNTKILRVCACMHICVCACVRMLCLYLGCPPRVCPPYGNLNPIIFTLAATISLRPVASGCRALTTGLMK